MSLLGFLRQAAQVQEGLFRAWDDMAVEVEVAEFLYGLIRTSKPDLVIEAGSGNGYASVFMASALAENQKGQLISYDHDERYSLSTAATCAWLPVVTVTGRSFEHEGEDPDIVFIDSLGEMREEDIDYWLARRDGKMTIVLHDANRYSPAGGVHITAGRGVWIVQ